MRIISRIVCQYTFESFLLSNYYYYSYSDRILMPFPVFLFSCIIGFFFFPSSTFMCSWECLISSPAGECVGFALDPVDQSCLSGSLADKSILGENGQGMNIFMEESAGLASLNTYKGIIVKYRGFV